LSWVRRSRSGWTWLSGVDTPLAEEREVYRLTLRSSAGERVVELEEARYTYARDDQLADGLPGILEVAAVQRGTLAGSRPAFISLTVS
jgi:hypothetical protein